MTSVLANIPSQSGADSKEQVVGGLYTTNHVESYQSAAVASEWFDAMSDGDDGVRGGECGVQTDCDIWAGEIVADDDSILPIRRRRVPLQCDIV